MALTETVFLAMAEDPLLLSVKEEDCQLSESDPYSMVQASFDVTAQSDLNLKTEESYPLAEQEGERDPPIVDLSVITTEAEPDCLLLQVVPLHVENPDTRLNSDLWIVPSPWDASEGWTDGSLCRSQRVNQQDDVRGDPEERGDAEQWIVPEQHDVLDGLEEAPSRAEEYTQLNGRAAQQSHYPVVRLMRLTQAELRYNHNMSSVLFGGDWHSAWNRLVDYLGEDFYTYWFWGPFATFNTVYLLVGGFFTLLDFTFKYNIVRKYKTQPGTNEPVDTKQLMKVMPLVLFNLIVVGMPFFYIFAKIMLWRGTPPLREFPPIWWIFVSMLVFIGVEEVGFYYSHRLLHNRHLYHHIHKIHHEWPSPVAFTALYCHPVEHLFSTLMPPAIGVFIMGSHVATGYIMIMLLLTSAVVNHSGYHLPFFLSQEFHDYHHLKFTECFGQLGILDRLHSTDTSFVKSGYELRHRLLTSFVPMSKLQPLIPSKSNNE